MYQAASSLKKGRTHVGSDGSPCGYVTATALLTWEIEGIVL